MLIRALHAVVVMLTGSVGPILADQTTVSFDSGSQQIFDNPSLHGNSQVALSGGSTADGNGDVLQLGYFSTATIVNPFSGTWIPLSGQTSANTALVPSSNDNETYNQTSIGDL